MDRSRSVSPLGASRFERPYIPSSPNNASPTTPASADSFASHIRSAVTAASSIDTRTTNHDMGSKSWPDSASTASEMNDDWFNRFRSDSDLSANVSDHCPDRAVLAAAYDLPIFSADGTPRSFGSLFDPSYATHQRQLIIFVRHFYCGACQAYLKALTSGITMQDYFSIPIPTSIIVIGCGQPDLIPHYRKFTNCSFPIFADPSRALFKQLGMVVSVNVGNRRPEYMKDISIGAWAKGQLTQVRASMKETDGIRKRDVLRGGNPMQIGGEFLLDEGEVVWCNRMKNYRDHAEIGVLRKLLELDDA